MAAATAIEPKPKLTYEDYASLPDDERYELIDGELLPTPSSKEIHQAVSGALFMSVGMFVRLAGMGRIYFAPFDVILSATNVVQPDLIFVSSARAHIITEDNIRGAPDLLVEILSPSTAGYDRTTKRNLYARHGVGEYWLVDPYAKTITALILGAGGAGQSHLIGRVGISFADTPSPSPLASASPPRRFSATSHSSPISAPNAEASTCSPPRVQS